ncbi:MAG: choice-of-anchor B family protein [Bacteroidota bacterium]
MKNFTHIFILCLIAINGYGQENFNLELLSNVDVGEDGNDIWGYVDSTGLEYAIMGTRNTTKIWSLEDPENPIERASIPGPRSTWRDIKSFEDHLYVTTDRGDAGLLIIDMSMAPDSISSLYWHPIFDIEGSPDTLDKCHNLYIDTDDGFCYLAGCDVSNQGVLILDLKNDKKEPVLAGIMDNNYSHDVFVKNNKMYTSDIFIGSFNVYDVTDKANLVYLGGASTSRQFTHNAWLSDDEKYLFTTDERANAWVDAFDVSDLEDIRFLDRFQPAETVGTGVIPHNTHYFDGFLVTSWYTDGLVIVDANKPDNLVKVAAYDTETVFTEDFEGCWGAYPYLPSGLILASDINHGLFVFQPKRQDGENGYQRACYLEGTVTDANTGASISNATISILSTNPNEENTGLSGRYRTGQITPGTFGVEFRHPLYDTETRTATIESGEVTILDMQMKNYEITGTVKNENGDPIEGATILIENTNEDVNVVILSDEEGNWSTRIKRGVIYTIYAAQWGYKGSFTLLNFVPGNTVDFILEEGYEDDFFADLGWSVSGNATDGVWEIAKPNFIFGGGQTTQTSNDIQTDLGSTYYITGAGGNSIGGNDVDGGSTVLTSQPMDFTGYERIDFSYYLWFSNLPSTNNPDPNDFVTVSVTNGIDTIELTRDDQNGSSWSSIIETSVDISEMEFNDNMRIIVFTADREPGHIVEAGFDSFKAVGFKATNVIEQTNLGISISPNPTNNFIILRTKWAWEGEKRIVIFDGMGKVVKEGELTNPTMQIELDNLPSGLYTMQVRWKYNRSETVKFSKI